MTTAAICATREVSWHPSFYRGEQFDSDLALYYLRARYYNPNTGRFMSRDPKEFKPLKSKNNPVDSRRLHKYLYAGADPVNRVDPTGRTMADYPLLIMIGGTAAIIGAEVVFTIETAKLWGMYDPPPGGDPQPHPGPGTGEPGPGGGCPLCGEGGPPVVPPGSNPYPFPIQGPGSGVE